MDEDKERLKHIKDLTDKAYTNSQVTREQGSDDLVFYHVTQWDDNLLGTSDLKYRGQFDLLHKAVRQANAELIANTIQVHFDPIDDTADEQAEFLSGLYLTDDRSNSSQEAYNNAQMEALVCGVGAWELYTEYESNRSGSSNQVIKRAPIHEANNNVFWDPNSKLADKSDADYVCILTPYSKDAYKDLARNLTGDEDYEPEPSDFKFPQQSYAFPWMTGDFEHVYVATFYEREMVEDKILRFQEPITGEIVQYYESEAFEVLDELEETGHILVDSKEVERYQVTKSIASGADILAEYIIAGENIPVVPVYGERAFVEGQEYWAGLVRLAKDAQRLHNFTMSYIADIASRSPRPKPVVFPEQIAGFEDMYEESEINYPYTLMNRKTIQGEDLPLQFGQLPEQPVPSSLNQLIPLTQQAVSDVAGEAMPKDFANVDLSGKALTQLNQRIDQQSYEYQENMKHAKRRDAEIYWSMAVEIYDVPRKVYLTLPDGTRKEAQVMKQIYDQETGQAVTVNDIRSSTFNVYTDIGQSYQTQRNAVRDQIAQMIALMPQDDPMRQVYMLKHTEMLDGLDFKDVREYARKQLIQQGIKEPETDEEKEMMAQLQAQSANQQPDPATIMAMAEMEKAKADQMQQQREMIKDQADVQKGKADTAIDMYNAETKRFEAETKAQESGAKVRLEGAKVIAKQYNDAASMLRGSANAF